MVTKAPNVVRNPKTSKQQIPVFMFAYIHAWLSNEWSAGLDGVEDALRGETDADQSQVQGLGEATQQLLNLLATLEAAVRGVQVKFSGDPERGLQGGPATLAGAPQGAAYTAWNSDSMPAAVVLKPVLELIARLVELMEK